jgi:hypothetical protein
VGDLPSAISCLCFSPTLVWRNKHAKSRLHYKSVEPFKFLLVHEDFSCSKIKYWHLTISWTESSAFSLQLPHIYIWSKLYFLICDQVKLTSWYILVSFLKPPRPERKEPLPPPPLHHRSVPPPVGLAVVRRVPS